MDVGGALAPELGKEAQKSSGCSDNSQKNVQKDDSRLGEENLVF